MNVSLVYTFLFAGSIILINPWGSALNLVNTGRAEIWTHPKVFVVAAVTLVNLFQIAIRNHQRQDNTSDYSSHKVFAKLWVSYIAVAAIATVLSPFPMHSLLGHSVLGDGLLYWLLIGAFSCSNAFLLIVRPDLFKPQLYGFLVGGSILALSIFPQLVDWRIDYTAISGQISKYDNQLLESGIWQMQMPIGLYSNRGYAAFVLASVSGLSLVSTLKQWVLRRLGVFCFCLMGLALVATQARAGIVALLIGITYWPITEYYRAGRVSHRQLQQNKLLWIGLLAGAICAAYSIHFLLGGILSWEHSILTTLQDGSTGRFYLWSVAVKGILARPWIGWGFNGFGIAQLFVGDWDGRLSSYIPEGSSIAQILQIYESTFAFLGPDGEIYTGSVLTHKAHNLILDLLLSTGLLGLVAYGALFSFGFWCLTKSKLCSLTTIAIVYLVFTQFWFESAQYSHVFWWVLSLGIAIQGKKDHV